MAENGGREIHSKVRTPDKGGRVTLTLMEMLLLCPWHQHYLSHSHSQVLRSFNTHTCTCNNTTTQLVTQASTATAAQVLHKRFHSTTQANMSSSNSRDSFYMQQISLILLDHFTSRELLLISCVWNLHVKQSRKRI